MSLTIYAATFGALVLVCVGLLGLMSYTSSDKNSSFLGAKIGKLEQSYLNFRNNYLAIYLCMMMADWLQGPYVYALYKSYNYGLEEIGILFIVGFLSSAIFGTVISSLADQYGRKKMAILFSFIYVSSCLTKFSSNFIILLLGRLLGGIATSLLFSVFEAWMVSEHNSRGFNPDLLSETFSAQTFGNGVVAIASGLLADTVVSLTAQLVAPFVLSALFLIIGGFLVHSTWTENYGSQPSPLTSIETSESSILKGVTICMKDPKILYLGLIVSLFEGCMYTFVFLWGPVLEKNQSSGIPFGLIFATFMVCIMIGSVLFKFFNSRLGQSAEKLAQPVMLLAVSSFAALLMFDSHIASFFAFNVFELCCGIYFPMIGLLRSKYVPENVRTTVMNLFRVPLNLIVVIVLLKVGVWTHKLIFTLCCLLLLITFIAASLLQRASIK